MCCFAMPVRKVSATRIFARLEGNEQRLAYQMSVDTATENAMVLPIPVKRNGSEEAVRFINLEDATNLFKDIESLFPVPTTMMVFASRALAAGKTTPLKVHDVGAFDASYVPTTADFSRLDERFRLPEQTWDSLPGYRDFGFAVFKLKKGNQKLHPMAFAFPTRHADRLFFPTVHIHDGAVRPSAHFDHSLYCQPRSEDGRTPQDPWEVSESAARVHVDASKTGGLIHKDLFCYRLKIEGDRTNKDMYVEV